MTTIKILDGHRALELQEEVAVGDLFYSEAELQPAWLPVLGNMIGKRLESLPVRVCRPIKTTAPKMQWDRLDAYEQKLVRDNPPNSPIVLAFVKSRLNLTAADVIEIQEGRTSILDWLTQTPLNRPAPVPPAPRTAAQATGAVVVEVDETRSVHFTFGYEVSYRQVVTERYEGEDDFDVPISVLRQGRRAVEAYIRGDYDGWTDGEPDTEYETDDDSHNEDVTSLASNWEQVLADYEEELAAAEEAAEEAADEQTEPEGTP